VPCRYLLMPQSLMIITALFNRCRTKFCQLEQFVHSTSFAEQCSGKGSCRTRNQKFAGSIRSTVMTLGKLFTHRCHCHHSIIWYWPKSDDAVWLGRLAPTTAFMSAIVNFSTVKAALHKPTRRARPIGSSITRVMLEPTGWAVGSAHVVQPSVKTVLVY